MLQKDKDIVKAFCDRCYPEYGPWRVMTDILGQVGLSPDKDTSRYMLEHVMNAAVRHLNEVTGGKWRTTCPEPALQKFRADMEAGRKKVEDLDKRAEQWNKQREES